MKIIITILGLLYGVGSFGQNCFCDKDSMLNELISCDTILFDNHSKLFWNFNCDSSWLTFEDPVGKNEIIFSLGGAFINLTGRLGYIYAQEYKNTFLIRNNVISGCCSPPEYYLFDKRTGELKKDLGRIVYYSQDREKPFIIAVTGSNYDTTSTADYNSLSVYNVDNDKTYFVALPKNEIKKALKRTEEIYPEYLFDEPAMEGDELKLVYYLQKPQSGKVDRARRISMIWRNSDTTN